VSPSCTVSKILPLIETLPQSGVVMPWCCPSVCLFVRLSVAWNSAAHQGFTTFRLTWKTPREKIPWNLCLRQRHPSPLSHIVEEIHSVGTINNVETSYFTQLKMCYLMTTFRCPSDILITSWLFTVWWSSLWQKRMTERRKKNTLLKRSVSVTMAVSVVDCEILSVKEWRDLENRSGVVQCHWKWRRSIEHNATVYW